MLLKYKIKQNPKTSLTSSTLSYHPIFPFLLVVNFSKQLFTLSDSYSFSPILSATLTPLLKLLLTWLSMPSYWKSSGHVLILKLLDLSSTYDTANNSLLKMLSSLVFFSITFIPLFFSYFIFCALLISLVEIHRYLSNLLTLEFPVPITFFLFYLYFPGNLIWFCSLNTIYRVMTDSFVFLAYTYLTLDSKQICCSVCKVSRHNG